MTRLTIYLILINIVSLLIFTLTPAAARLFYIRKKLHLFPLLLTVAGGGIGILISALFTRKTSGIRRKERFLISFLTLIELLILLIVGSFFIPDPHSPRYRVQQQLKKLQALDNDTLEAFIQFENMTVTGTASVPVSSGSAMKAASAFFHDFHWKIRSQRIMEDTAVVQVQIRGIDAHALAMDLAREITSDAASAFASSVDESTKEHPQLPGDYYAIMNDLLKENKYGTVSSEVTFHLTLTETPAEDPLGHWEITVDDELLDGLMGGFISLLGTPDLLSPQDVLTIYLDELKEMTSGDWKTYLGTSDIFSLYSAEYSSVADDLYFNALADHFSYEIHSDQTDTADLRTVPVTITSLDMNAILADYHSRLIAYAGTIEASAADNAGRSEEAAKLLTEAIVDGSDKTTSFDLRIAMENNGIAWRPIITEEFTDALLGGLKTAMEAFTSS